MKASLVMQVRMVRDLEKEEEQELVAFTFYRVLESSFSCRLCVSVAMVVVVHVVHFAFGLEARVDFQFHLVVLVCTRVLVALMFS